MTDARFTRRAASPSGASPSGASPGGASLGVILAALIAAVAGVLVGAHWHETIGAWIGRGESGAQQQPRKMEASSTAPARLWTCGMHPQVIQEKPGICPICGMALVPIKAEPAGRGAEGERVVRYWWDPMMDPPYISDRPGKSPMGMELIPVYADEVSAGPAVLIDPVVVQNMGVRVAAVTEGPLRATVRAVGYLDEAQPNQQDINLRVSGWIERLYADTEGMHLRKGDPLFDLYSPELQVGIEELIAAGRARATLAPDAQASSRTAAESVYAAAERKLRLWGLGQAQIDRLAALERAPRAVTFRSPITAHVMEKSVVEGAAVKAGDRVLRIVDHGVLWLDAQVYEQQLPFVRLGQRASATVPAIPGQRFEGEVIFIHPHVDPMTRTALVRVQLPNEPLTLRPGMYATVEIRAELAPRALLVPREAVIDTGTRQIAFVALDGGRFEPRTVKLGAAGNDGVVQVLEGLAPGELTVTSGQFLLDAESRLREAIQKLLDDKGRRPGGVAPPPAAPGHHPHEGSHDPHHH